MWDGQIITPFYLQVGGKGLQYEDSTSITFVRPVYKYIYILIMFNYYLIIYVYQPFNCFLEAQCNYFNPVKALRHKLFPRYPSGELWIISHRSQATTANLKEIQQDTKDGLRFGVRIEMSWSHAHLSMIPGSIVPSNWYSWSSFNDWFSFLVFCGGSGWGWIEQHDYLLYLTLPF